MISYELDESAGVCLYAIVRCVIVDIAERRKWKYEKNNQDVRGRVRDSVRGPGGDGSAGG